MEAANRGAQDVGAESVGLNIVLPHEQTPNLYVTPRSVSSSTISRCARCISCFVRGRWRCFRAASARSMKSFELLTLVQTGKMKHMPILLFGKEFWQRVVNFEELMPRKA